MDFRHTDGRKVSVFLPRRSVLVMMGESRYLWTHGYKLILYPCTLNFSQWITFSELVYMYNRKIKFYWQVV